jgi:hypothetical protein
MTKSLVGTKSHENLKHAFAGESQANRRYLYFACVADIEGYPDVCYVRFQFEPAACRVFIDGEKAELMIDHPNYKASAVLTPEVQKSLAEDLINLKMSTRKQVRNTNNLKSFGMLSRTTSHIRRQIRFTNGCARSYQPSASEQFIGICKNSFPTRSCRS